MSGVFVICFCRLSSIFLCKLANFPLYISSHNHPETTNRFWISYGHKILNDMQLAIHNFLGLLNEYHPCPRCLIVIIHIYYSNIIVIVIKQYWRQESWRLVWWLWMWIEIVLNCNFDRQYDVIMVNIYMTLITDAVVFLQKKIIKILWWNMHPHDNDDHNHW